MFTSKKFWHQLLHKIQNLWICKYFSLQRVEYWTQEVSYFTEKLKLCIYIMMHSEAQTNLIE